MLLRNPVYSFSTKQQIFTALHFTVNFVHSVVIKANDSSFSTGGEMKVIHVLNLELSLIFL